MSEDHIRGAVHIPILAPGESRSFTFELPANYWDGYAAAYNYWSRPWYKRHPFARRPARGCEGWMRPAWWEHQWLANGGHGDPMPVPGVGGDS